MKVLITGVAGFIGMHTALELINRGVEVVGIDSLNSYYSQQLKVDRIEQIRNKEKGDCFVFIQGDLVTLDWNRSELRDVSTCIHLAAQAGVRYSLENPMEYINSNIIGFHKLMEFVVRKNIRFLYASSSSVYGNDTDVPFNEDASCAHPESYYAATKRANELMAYSYYKTKGLVSVGMRFFTVYGPWGRPDMAPMIFTKSAIEKRAINVFNFGNQQRDFTYISDIVDGILKILKGIEDMDSPRVLNIGRGEPIRLMDFISSLEESLNIPIEKNFVIAQLGDVTRTYADISQMKMLFDYEPKVSIKEGLSELVKWYKEYYNNAIH